MRQELRDATATAATALGQAGVWWTSGGRIDIASEARAARSCRLCRQRKAALSPFAIAGSHDVATDLSPAAIEAIHRIVSDPGRLSEAWYRRITAQGLADEGYVELLSVVAIVTALDTFDRATGAPLRDLMPASRPGPPTHRRPKGAKPGLGWMPMLAPADVGPEDRPGRCWPREPAALCVCRPLGRQRASGPQSRPGSDDAVLGHV